MLFVVKPKEFENAPAPKPKIEFDREFCDAKGGGAVDAFEVTDDFLLVDDDGVND